MILVNDSNYDYWVSYLNKLKSEVHYNNLGNITNKHKEDIKDIELYLKKYESSLYKRILERK